jgi:hypothetical protein
VDDLTRNRIELANRGDVDAGLRLIKEFRDTVVANRSSRDGRPLVATTPFNEVLLDWFSDCFGKILDGVEPAIALGIKREKGDRASVTRDPQVRLSQDAAICLAVLEFRNDLASLTLADAKRRAALKFNIGIEKVGHAWKNKTALASAELARRMSRMGGSSNDPVAVEARAPDRKTPVFFDVYDKQGRFMGSLGKEHWDRFQEMMGQ